MASHRLPRAIPTTVLWCVAVVALSGVRARAGQGAMITGEVVTEAGRPLGAPVTLQLEFPNGQVLDQKIVGTDGQFELLNLGSSLYRLRFTAQGFQSVAREVDLTGVHRFERIRVVMVPVGNAKTAPGGVATVTDEQAPKKARKEYERASQALQKNDPGEAQKHLEKAVDEFPCYARAQTDLAMVLIEQKKVPPAEAALRKALACDADFPVAYERLGALLSGTGRYGDSEKVLEEGLRRAPNQWSLHFELGAAYSGLGEFAKAKEEYEKVSALNASPPPELHVRLADLYTRMKDYPHAYAEMRAYLRQDPDGRLAERTRAVMRAMEASGVLRSASPAAPTQDH